MSNDPFRDAADDGPGSANLTAMLRIIAARLLNSETLFPNKAGLLGKITC